MNGDLPPWQRQARAQYGVLTRAQALDLGLSRKTIECHVRAGRWQRLHPGVFATTPGIVPWITRASAAVRAVGEGAVLTLESAGHVWGFRDQPPAMISIGVPETRRIVRPLGVRVRRRRQLAPRVTRQLPVTSREQTVLDLIDAPGCEPEEAVGLLAAAMNSGKGTQDMSQRILNELATRRTQQHRDVVHAALADLQSGVESVAEFLFVDRVERPHRLPTFDRQTPASGAARRDFELAEYGIIVEIDGYLWHGKAAFHADRRRDRFSAREGKITLRAGWVDVAHSPCELALDIGLTLRSRGWFGALAGCGNECAVIRAWQQHLVRKI